MLVATVPYPFNTQLRELILFLQEKGWDVHVLCSNRPDIEGISFHRVTIKRSIAPFYDLVSLWKLFWLLRKERFPIVHSFNPKSGLLCAIAAKISNTPVRLHTFTGQVWVTLKGTRRFVSRFGDIVIGKLNTHCYCDSDSQKSFLIQDGVISSAKISVLGGGSLSGVNTKKFDRALFSKNDYTALRKKMGFSKDDFVLLFVGRLTKDKGIRELLKAYSLLRYKHQEIKLLLVGPEEKDFQETLKFVNLSDMEGVVFTGYARDPEKYMFISDLFVLPSYREGFGSVIIEAGAMGLPSVGSSIYGIKDAIDNGNTGILTPVKDVRRLVQAIEMLIVNITLRKNLGNNALKRAVNFSSDKMNKCFKKEYDFFLVEKNYKT